MSLSKTKKAALNLAAYAGDGAVLLAFNLDESKTDKLAGFAIKCKAPTKGPYPTDEHFLKNRLSFNQQITKDTKADPTTQEDSDKAPFQTFHWVHFPSAGPGKYQYTLYAAYFDTNSNIKLGDSIAMNVDLTSQCNNFTELGYTRGYISSQAYADYFSNKDIRPSPKTMDYDTTNYQKQYQWLGGHAREMIFNFLGETQKDPTLGLDVFAYDFDEPDIIRALCQMSKQGKQIRVFQDDATLHTDAGALEPQTISALKAAGVSVQTGHFNRFAHDKVMIQRKGTNKTPIKVLTGSANFSVRGLYVQTNSILVFTDANIAALYGQAFDQAFNDPKKFKTSPIASQWFDIKTSPPLSISFAPHKTTFSLDKVADAVEKAKSSVLFAVMEMSGSGRALADLKNLSNNPNLFSLGTIESKSDLQLFKPGINSAVTSFSYLAKNIPDPFKAEWSGGAGQVIHHKFIVCDFNTANPVVFCGSSNLAEGGETSNGDNLLAIYDTKVAIEYAVEAIRIFDHYRFRSLQQSSTTSKPLALSTNQDWIKPYYDPKNIKYLERKLLSQT